VQSPLKEQARTNKEERRRADTSIGKQLFCPGHGRCSVVPKEEEV
jgi:hypothetical protein